MSSSTPAAGTGPAYSSIQTAGALYALLCAVARHRARDVSLTALSTLVTLARTGPRRITDLAVVEGVTQPSVTSLVTALERAGLVERRGDCADRRVVLVAITAAGAAVLHARRQANVEVFAQFIDTLPADEAAALAAAGPALEHLCRLDDALRDPRCAIGDPLPAELA